MNIGTLNQLKRLRKEPSATLPFHSLHEFNQWADEVYPLLKFNMYFSQNFKRARKEVAIQNTSQLTRHHLENINKTIQIVNHAIAALENDLASANTTRANRSKWRPILYGFSFTAIGFLLGAGSIYSFFGASNPSIPLKTTPNAFCEIEGIDKALDQHEKVINKLITQLMTYEKKLGTETSEKDQFTQAAKRIREDIKEENQSYTDRIKQLEAKCKI